MGIIQKLEEEIKKALKSRDQILLETVRMMKAAVKNKEIELIRPLSEAEFNAVLSSMVKQRKDSIDQFQKGGRADLVAKEEKELAIVESYLPKPLTDKEISSMVDGAISKAGAHGPQDMGSVMKLLKEGTSGRVDGKVLADLVKQKLQTLG